MSEIRLMAMRFVPSDEGGYWTPAADGSDTAGFQNRAWADAWEAAITEEEADQLDAALDSVHPLTYDDPCRVKLRAAFNQPVPEDSPDA